jgi:hypothetical protein
MQTIPSGGPVEIAGRAYLEERTTAGRMSPFWLRTRYRRLMRQRTTLDDNGMAALKAVRDEIEDRGHELPEVG